jgi:hypothetical protein
MASTGPSSTIHVFWFLFLAALCVWQGADGHWVLCTCGCVHVCPCTRTRDCLPDVPPPRLQTHTQQHTPAPQHRENAVRPVAGGGVHAAKHLRRGDGLGVHAPDDVLGAQLCQSASQHLHDGRLAAATGAHQHDAVAHLLSVCVCVLTGGGAQPPQSEVAQALQCTQPARACHKHARNLNPPGRSRTAGCTCSASSGAAAGRARPPLFQAHAKPLGTARAPP